MIPNKEKKLRVDVISGNRIPANDLVLGYYAPLMMEGKPVVIISNEDVEKELMYWKNSAIMYVLGKDLSMNAVKQFMMRYWNFVQLPQLFYHDEGYFLMKFNSKQEREMVLMRWLYTIHNMPMIVKNWHPDFNIKRDMVRTIPIWVTLPNIPFYLWGPTSLGKIGISIGKLILTYEYTANKLGIKNPS
ncbi:unnamed protein product [Vicia faba]|uniref:DUF4283 domain-containing protein n=1 Tax=Vicia faba TaxID=3906 RepID=A0AAV1AQ01_VICFA|nr:unnamed protein product [Vicia faba]